MAGEATLLAREKAAEVLKCGFPCARKYTSLPARTAASPGPDRSEAPGCAGRRARGVEGRGAAGNPRA